MKKFKIKLIFIFLVSLNTSLVAHPHLFAGVDLDYDLTQVDTLVVSQRWMFDDLTSMIILEDFDSDGDDNINPTELTEIKESVIPGLKEKGFYTDLVINEERILFDEIYNFSVGVEDIYVYYKFDIHVPLDFNNSDQIIKINIYDREFYTKFFVNADSGLKVIKPDEVSFLFDVYENEDKSYYFGQLSPLEVKLTLTKD